MGDTWVTDMTHYLSEDGRVAEMSRQAARLATYLGAIVSAISGRSPGMVDVLEIACRRRPGRRPCTGRIEAILDLSEDRIRWGCPVCRDNGYISKWRGTPWDRALVS